MDQCKFGNWVYDPVNFGLEHWYPDAMPYRLPFEELTDPSKVLDRLFQLNGEKWMTTEDKGHLVEAICAVLGRSMCYVGSDAMIDGEVRGCSSSLPKKHECHAFTRAGQHSPSTYTTPTTTHLH